MFEIICCVKLRSIFNQNFEKELSYKIGVCLKLFVKLVQNGSLFFVFELSVFWLRVFGMYLEVKWFGL